MMGEQCGLIIVHPAVVQMNKGLALIASPYLYINNL